MRKREIDLFGIFIGIIIGGLFGYYIGQKLLVSEEKVTPVAVEAPENGNIYLLQLLKTDNLNDIENIMKNVNVNYEVVQDYNIYYVYVYVSTDLEKINNKKLEFSALGFNPTIKNEYIIDYPNKYRNDINSYTFYTDVVNYFLASLNNEEFIIDEKYYTNPVDLLIFSDLTLLQTIKNETIKQQIHLEIYQKIFTKLN